MPQSSLQSFLARRDDPDVDQIVTTETALYEARFQQQIDQLESQIDGLIRMLAFNRRSTPEISGFVSRISADVSKDQQTGNIYYTVRNALPPSEIAKLTDKDLHRTAGMRSEVYVQTSSRTALEYLVKPVRDQMARAFNER